jgi:hypothetical protein
MPRSEMGSLIERLRRLVGDDGVQPVFDDDVLQEALDAFQERYVHQGLSPLAPFPPYLAYEAGPGNWASNAVIEDSTGAVGPSNADLIGGKWYFTITTPPPLFVTGQTYDIYAAARVVIEWWLGKEKGGIKSWTADGITVTKEKREDLERLHGLYGSRVGAGGTLRTARMRRRDVVG